MSFDLPSQAGAVRDAAIVRHVASGDYELAWSTVRSQANGHTGTFNVFADALKIGGVRISASATLLQTLADMLGCVLLTPRLSDLMFQQAHVVIPPQIISPPGTDTATMVKESQKIDASTRGTSGLIAPMGKPWCLSNVLLAHPGRAALYGWQSTKSIPGIPLYPGVSSGVKVIQPLSTAHDATYVDYAMLAVLASRRCVVDGEPVDLATVLQDPSMSALVSHEGPLRLLRQPGVPIAKSLEPLCVGPNCPEPVSFQTGGGSSSSSGGGGLTVIALASGAAGLLGGLAMMH